MSSIINLPDEVKHSAAHVLAMAVSRVYPNVRIGIGPVTKTGFYYDFEIPEELDSKKVSQIEDEANKIAKENLPFQQIIVSKQAAVNLMLQRGQIYKAELINVIADEEISFYKTGEEFFDLCRGPHVNSTSELGPIIITNVEEVHWNEDPERPKLKRITGMVFRNYEEVEEYKKSEGLKKTRNYVNILKNKSLGFLDGNNLILTPRGSNIYNNIMRDIKSPFIANGTEIFTDIYAETEQEISQVIDKYLFKNQVSNKELPLTVYTTAYCRKVAIKDLKKSSFVFIAKTYFKESDIILNLSRIEDIINSFNIENSKLIVNVEFHNPENSVFNSVSNILQKNMISHNKVISDRFDYVYLEVMAKDDLGREWMIAKMRVQPQNLPDIEIGSLEVSISPVNLLAFKFEDMGEDKSVINYTDVYLIPISKKFVEAAKNLSKTLKEMEYTTQILFPNKSLTYRIRKAELEQPKLIAILGTKEIQTDSVSVRKKGNNIGLVRVEELENYLKG